MRGASSSRSSSFDKLRNAHVSEDLIVVVVAMRVCLHGENGLHSVAMIENSTIIEAS